MHFYWTHELLRFLFSLLFLKTCLPALRVQIERVGEDVRGYALDTLLQSLHVDAEVEESRLCVCV